MENIKKIAIIAGVVVVFFLLLIFAFMHRNTPQNNYRVNLEVWGLFDDSGTFAKAIDEYKKRNPYIGDIVYKKLTVDSYESELLSALATGKGPDIFLIHNSWLSKHGDKLAPAPQTVLALKDVQDSFPDVVAEDFTQDQNVWALPLSVDSLALYANKDFFNQAGLSRAPQTWMEFDEAVRRLTKIDSFGNIQQSGAAMGMSSDASSGGGKINRATDILTLLMAQSGAEMLNDGNSAAMFAEYIAGSDGQQYSPGERALAYYAKFSDPGKQEYSWNSQMHNSIDSFIEGKTAMMINYSWLIPTIQSKAPKLNFAVSEVPQNIDQSGKGLNIDFANYWGFAVSKNKVAENDLSADTTAPKSTSTNEQRIFEAWRFLRYLTMNPAYSQALPIKPASDQSAKFDPAADYVTELQKPAARRDLIASQANNSLLSPFAKGNLIAHSWRQPDNLAVEKIFDAMIDDVTLKNVRVQEAIQKAQNSVNLLIKN